MTTKSKVPQIRFKGFSGEWDIKKFGECVLIQRGGSPRPIENFITNNENGINWIKIGDVSTGSRYITQTKEKIIPEGEKHSRKVLIGDLILSNSMSFGRPYIMAIEGCIHDGWLLIRDEKKIFNLEYLLQLLSSEHMINQYKALASGGVVINLNSELVQSTNVFIPNKKEQTKIGDYFQRLDKLIEQKEKKYQKLKQFKKAMLSKMFPKNGADTPEIRFKGFSGKWEEKSLRDIANITIGEFVIKTKQNHNSPYPVYNGGKSYTGFYDEFNNDGNKIIISARGANAGYVNFETRKYWAGNSCYSIDFLDKNLYYIEFFYHYIKKNENKFTDHQQAANIPSVSKADVQKFIVHFPKIKEQEKIGNYFQKLDSQIDLQQKELEKLKNIKKASLAKMFV